MGPDAVPRHDRSFMRFARVLLATAAVMCSGAACTDAAANTAGVWITVSPATVNAGSQVTVRANCGDNVNSATVKSTAFGEVTLQPVNGQLSTQATIPADKPKATYEVRLSCSTGSRASTTLTVLNTTTAPTSDGDNPSHARSQYRRWLPRPRERTGRPQHVRVARAGADVTARRGSASPYGRSGTTAAVPSQHRRRLTTAYPSRSDDANRCARARMPTRASVGSRRRTALPIIACLLLLGAFATAVGLGQVLGIPLPTFSFDLSGDSGMKPSQPTRITIPSLGVRADVVEVGNTELGSIAAPVDDPAGTAGWYGYGPTPGEAGTAIIVGHVDTAGPSGGVPPTARDQVRQADRIAPRRPPGGDVHGRVGRGVPQDGVSVRPGLRQYRHRPGSRWLPAAGTGSAETSGMPTT